MLAASSIFAAAVSLGQTSCRQMAVLCAAAEKAGSVKDYAAKLGLSKPAVSRAIDALEEDGLARRLPHIDGRQITLAVTSKGARLVSALSHAAEG